MGQVCNAQCRWCPNPEPGIEAIQVHGGIVERKQDYAPNEIIQAAFNPAIKGVSFSGGEPLLRLAEILSIASYIRTRRPDVYLWVYTNGLLMTKEVLNRLCEAGIQEIRVDLAATDYSDQIIKKLDYIARKAVCTIEVPVVESQLRRLIDLLPNFQNSGVTYLNLHDLYIPHRWSEALENYDCRFIYTDPVSRYPRYLPSIGWIHTVFQAAQIFAPELHLNECALPNLANQWIAFQWQAKHILSETQLSFEEYKAANLPEFRKRGLTL